MIISNDYQYYMCIYVSSRIIIQIYALFLFINGIVCVHRVLALTARTSLGRWEFVLDMDSSSNLARSGDKCEYFRDDFPIFYTIMVCCV